MSSYIYDKALLNKFKRWTEGTELTLVGPDESRRLFQVISDKTSDSNIKFPLASLRRSLGYELDIFGKKPLSFDGMVKESDIGKSKSICAIPIILNYQLDIYTRYYQEADEYMRNFIFNIINYPKLEITIKYFNSNIDHVANILPAQSVIDNSSSTSERLFPGQFTRLSYQFSLPDAYLWDVRVRDNKEISTGELLIIDKATGEVIVENYL